MALWVELLKSAAAARYAPPLEEVERESLRTGRSAGGCLMRAVLIGAFLLFALVVAVFLFGWSRLQGCGLY